MNVTSVVDPTGVDSAGQAVLYVQDLLDASVLGTSSLRRAVDVVRAQVARGTFPGAALVVGRRGDVALSSGIGQIAWAERAVDPSVTRYDLASLTKVVATTSAVMLLVEDGRMALDAPVRRYLPKFTGGGKERVTVRQLLTHTSRLPSAGRSGSLARLVATRLASKPGARVRYSDLGMIVLWAAAERVAKESLPALLQRRVWTPLGMRATGFQPGEGCAACAPTRSREGYRGVVHDPIARQLGGIAGNAGLFSTASDLGRFAAMLASGGVLDSTRIFEEKTVRTFLRQQPKSDSRALGWDTRDGAAYRVHRYVPLDRPGTRHLGGAADQSYLRAAHVSRRRADQSRARSGAQLGCASRGGDRRGHLFLSRPVIRCAPASCDGKHQERQATFQPPRRARYGK